MNQDDDLKDPGLDKAVVESVAALQASEEEIAAYCDTSVDVIKEFYMDVVEKGWMKGKIKVRQLMLELAEKDKDPRAIEFIARNFIGINGVGH